MITSSAVKKFLDLNINVIGVAKDKRPSVKSWKKYMTEKVAPMDMAGVGFGLICGRISDNMEVVDIDLKYDDTGELYDQYVQIIKDNDPDLFDSLLIIQTPSGGYHWVYRCETIKGNQKLARKLDKDVLIETRGEGGYIAFIPKLYKAVQGGFGSIPTITPEQRDLLHAAAREFDQNEEIAKVPRAARMDNSSGKTPWDDYNEKVSCLEILEKHGWSFVYEDSMRAYVLRPGDTSAKYSGNILLADNLFRPWTSSTVFEPEKTYTSSSIYTILEHDGDFSAAARALREEGYGDSVAPTTSHEEYASTRQAPVAEKVDDELDFTEYLSNTEEDDEYLEAVRSGTLAMGLTTGSAALDEYYLIKRGTFHVVIGDSNIGKTTALLHEKVCNAVVHNHKSVILAMEDPAGKMKKKIMEFYMMKQLKDMNKGEMDEARNFLEEQFIILKGRGGLINTIPQALNVLYKMADKEEFDEVLIDPYSAFKKQLQRGQSPHDYDYDIAGDILNFCTRTDTIITLNSHTGTVGRRQRGLDDEGNKLPPHMDEVEGGGKWVNRADRVSILHRLISHANKGIRTVMDFYFMKERDLETGGWLHSRDKPTKFYMQPNMSEYHIDGETSIIQRYKAMKHEAKKGSQETIAWDANIEMPF